MEKYEFMERTWGFSRAPVRADGIYRPTDQFSRQASEREVDLFESRFLIGGIRGGLTYGYLWSQPHADLPPEPTGTGYGKTSLMHAIESTVNADFGEAVLKGRGMASTPAIVCGYASLNNEDTRGLYALLFSTIERWADPGQCRGPGGQSVLQAARARIVHRIGCDEEDESALAAEVERFRSALPGGGTLPPLRPDFLGGFVAADPDALIDALRAVTQGQKARNGLAYFQAAFACLAAGGVEQVFLFFDQLEYMVTNKTVTKAQKTREVARFRTVFTEDRTLADRCHVVFTLHDRASRELEEYWSLNRLPPFDPRSKETLNSVVVLRGLEGPDRIADLVRPYFDAVRPVGHAMRGSPEPLDSSAFDMLWRTSSARPGVILRRIATAIDLAAERNLPRVDRKLIEETMGIGAIAQPTGVARSTADDLIG